MKEIKLTQGKVALVDDEDFENLNQCKWFAMKHGRTFYAGRAIRVSGKRNTQSMHCLIMNGKGIDHIDHNGLNNQKSNLRFCTSSENSMNRRKKQNCTSIYKGVSFFKRDKIWRAEIEINYRHIRLGRFVSEVEAAQAYNKKAIELFGEFAHINDFS